MLTLRDFLAARAAISQAVLPKQAALDSLFTHGSSSASESWLKTQVTAGTISQTAAQTIYNDVERYEYLRAERFYASAAEQAGVSNVAAAIELQKQENYRRRLGEILAERKLINIETHQKITAVAKQMFMQDTSTLLTSFRDTLLGSRSNSTTPHQRGQTFSGRLVPNDLRPQTRSWTPHNDLTVSQRDNLSSTEMGFGEGFEDEELNGQMTISLNKAALDALDDDDDDDDYHAGGSNIDKSNLDGQMTIAITKDALNALDDDDGDEELGKFGALPPPISKSNLGGQMTIAMTTDALKELDDEDESDSQIPALRKPNGMDAGLPPPLNKANLGGQMTIALTTDALKELDDDEDDEGFVSRGSHGLPPALNKAGQATVNLNTKDLQALDDEPAPRQGFKFSAADLMSGNLSLPEAVEHNAPRPKPRPSKSAGLIGDPVLAMAIGEKYDVKKLLGQGQMGKVFLAHSKALGHDIALKFTRPTGRNAEEVLARFRREILVTTLVSHPNVVEVYDKEELPDGSYYMAMELLDGPDLKSYLKDNGPFEVPQALDLIEQMAYALNACHEAEVVHRDVKPENVTVLNHDGKLVAKLVDFGLARLLTSEEFVQNQIFTSLATQVSGSPHYMAPESITDSDKVDYRCDIYALGVTLFELLTGDTPFSGRNPNEILEHHLYSSVPHLEDRVEGKKFPKALNDFIRKLMAKERENRYQNCIAVLNDLKEVKAAKAEDSAGNGFFRSISDYFRRG